VAVAIERHGNRGMSQELMHEFGIVAAGEQQRDARVPEIVEADMR
jgi:hypothetical protein